MRDLDRALGDITAIREQMAAGMLFRGFGPHVIAGTGLLALLTAIAQSAFPTTLATDTETLLIGWIAIAIVCAGLVGIETIARTRRHHAGLADAMLMQAIEQFLPAGIAGAAIGAVLYSHAPDLIWMLPGIWSVLVALGMFSAARTLPPAIRLVAAWYLIAGVGVLLVAAGTRSAGPWSMGIPFVAGQLGMAAILYVASAEERRDVESL